MASIQRKKQRTSRPLPLRLILKIHNCERVRKLGIVMRRNL